MRIGQINDAISDYNGTTTTIRHSDRGLNLISTIGGGSAFGLTPWVFPVACSRTASAGPGGTGRQHRGARIARPCGRDSRALGHYFKVFFTCLPPVAAYRWWSPSRTGTPGRDLLWDRSALPPKLAGSSGRPMGRDLGVFGHRGLPTDPSRSEPWGRDLHGHPWGRGQVVGSGPCLRARLRCHPRPSNWSVWLGAPVSWSGVDI